MPGVGRKTPQVLRTWLLLGLVGLAFVSSCRAESDEVEEMTDELKELSIEKLGEDVLDAFIRDLGSNDQRWVRGSPNGNLHNLVSGWYSALQKRGFFGANQLTNLKSGFHKKSAADDRDLWGAYVEDKRGRSTFGNQLTNLNSGFHKRGEGDSGLFEDKRGRSGFSGAGRTTHVSSGFTKRENDDATQEEAAKRGRSSFNHQLTHVASGFAKRSDDSLDKRGRSAFSGANRLTNVGSGFKRGRSAFSGVRSLTNVGSGFKRDGNFNTGPMVYIPSGFVEKRAVEVPDVL